MPKVAADRSPRAAPSAAEVPSEAGLAMVKRLIAFDTTSRDSNLDLIRDVRGFLADHGVESTIVPDETGKKANLFATIGPRDRPGIMLSGHTDVVPVDGQPWSSRPFEAQTRDGRLYGRGSCDMKGFVGLVLAKVPSFAKARLKTPIHLAFSYDEEVGCIGVRRLIAILKDAPFKPSACIVGEPTQMRIVTAHKGKISMRCTVTGHEAHSSLAHKGVNAVEAAAEVVAFLKAMARTFRDKGPHDATFDPPYTTVHTGVIRGGTALNIVPLHCTFDFEFRHLPGEDPRALLARTVAFAEEKLLPEMRETGRRVGNADVGFAWSELSSFPGLATGEDEPVVQLAKALTGANAVEKVAFGTEAGLFQEAGIPTVIVGPGSIDQAHKPDEFCALSQYAQCEAFLDRLVARLSA